MKVLRRLAFAAILFLYSLSLSAQVDQSPYSINGIGDINPCHYGGVGKAGVVNAFFLAVGRLLFARVELKSVMNLNPLT